jgi:hypothetical protein
MQFYRVAASSYHPLLRSLKVSDSQFFFDPLSFLRQNCGGGVDYGYTAGVLFPRGFIY